MAIIEMLLGEFDAEGANTRKTLERFPEAKADWKPHTKSFSMTGLAGHVASLPGFAKAVASTERMDMKAGDYTPFYPKTASEALTRYEKEAKEAREALAKLSDADLGKTWTFAYEGQTMFEMPRAVALRSFYFTHIVHHRAQLTVYYRLNDVAVPGLYGPSADEQ
jgi:uncharacterized damage-inducible protein DinB